MPATREREWNETKRHDETIAATVDGDSSVRWALLTTKAIPERTVKASSKKNKRISPSAFIHIIFHLLFPYIFKFDFVLILSSWLLIFFCLSIYRSSNSRSVCALYCFFFRANCNVQTITTTTKIQTKIREYYNKIQNKNNNDHVVTQQPCKKTLEENLFCSCVRARLSLCVRVCLCVQRCLCKFVKHENNNNTTTKPRATAARTPGS